MRTILRCAIGVWAIADSAVLMIFTISMELSNVQACKQTSPAPFYCCSSARRVNEDGCYIESRMVLFDSSDLDLSIWSRYQ